VHFKRRYNEGFNLLIDPDNLEWLKLNHPEAELLTDHTVTNSPDQEPIEQEVNVQSDVSGMVYRYFGPTV